MANSSPARRRERRHGVRPQNGDVRRCPECGGRSEFSERYRFDGAVVPAWVCDSPACAHRVIARKRPGSRVLSAELIQASKEIRATANRAMMRSRARVERVEKTIARAGAKLRKNHKK